MANPSGTAASAPDWDALFEVAQSQAVYFTTPQGATAGYSSQLLDCLDAHVAPSLVRQAVLQARSRGLIRARDQTRLDAELSGQRRKAVSG